MWGIGSKYDMQTYTEAPDVVSAMSEYGWSPIKFDQRTGVPKLFGVRPFREETGAWHVVRAVDGWAMQRLVSDFRRKNLSGMKTERLPERFPTPVALATWWEIKCASERA